MLDKIIVSLAGLALIVFVNVYYFAARLRSRRPPRSKTKAASVD